VSIAVREDTREVVVHSKDPSKPMLTFSTDTKLYLDASGYCELKCRIEDVSQNHKKKKDVKDGKKNKESDDRKFVIEVSIVPEDEEEELAWGPVVHPVYTDGILVKSKITDDNLEKYANKELAKQQMMLQQELQRTSRAPVVASSSSSASSPPLPGHVGTLLQQLKNELVKLQQRKRVGMGEVAKHASISMPIIDELIRLEEAMAEHEVMTLSNEESSVDETDMSPAVSSPPHITADEDDEEALDIMLIENIAVDECPPDNEAQTTTTAEHAAPSVQAAAQSKQSHGIMQYEQAAQPVASQSVCPEQSAQQYVQSEEYIKQLPILPPQAMRVGPGSNPANSLYTVALGAVGSGAEDFAAAFKHCSVVGANDE